MVRYFTGKPCPAGHITERWVSTGACCACIRDRTKRWQSIEANKELNRRYAKQAAARDPAKRANAFKAWRRKNPDRWKALNAKWHALHPYGRRLHQATRRARMKSAGGSFTAAQVANLIEAQGNRCPYCRVVLGTAFQIDHIKPIARGGSNDVTNIQLLCIPCNQRKHTKSSALFAVELATQERTTP